jgi:hypothetical protein
MNTNTQIPPKLTLDNTGRLMDEISTHMDILRYVAKKAELPIEDIEKKYILLQDFYRKILYKHNITPYIMDPLKRDPVLIPKKKNYSVEFTTASGLIDPLSINKYKRFKKDPTLTKPPLSQIMNSIPKKFNIHPKAEWKFLKGTKQHFFKK